MSISRWLGIPGFASIHAPRLEGASVYLRIPRRADFPEWAALRDISRGFLQPYEPRWTKASLTGKSYRARLARMADESRAGGGCGFFIFRRADDALLGGVNLVNIRRGVVQAASLGYWIGRPHARQGYMADALACLIDYAFGELGLHRLEAACLPDNAASRALLLGAGFEEEGTARRSIRIDGEWRDHDMYGLVR